MQAPMGDQCDGRSKHYRYRTLEQTGTLKLHEDRVECLNRRGFTRWHFDVRYQDLVYAPIKNWQTSTTCWMCLLVGAAGGITSIIRLVGLDVSMPIYLAVPILALSTLLLVIAFRMRREEWITIPTTAPGLGVFLCRQGPDANRFDAFAAELCRRVLAAQSNQPSQPKSRFDTAKLGD